MSEVGQVQVCLGNEYDKALHAALLVILVDLGATLKGQGQWSVAGSQELWQMDVVLDEHTIHIESETYIGLSITGPTEIVEKIQRKLKDDATVSAG